MTCSRISRKVLQKSTTDKTLTARLKADTGSIVFGARDDLRREKAKHSCAKASGSKTDETNTYALG